MPYSQTHIETDDVPEILPVRRWDNVLAHTLPEARSPFLRPSWWQKGKKKLLLATVRAIEHVFATKLYTENDHVVLYQLSPETRSLLSWLATKGLLQQWHLGRSIPGGAKICTLYLSAKSFITPAGTLCIPGGANGLGAGDTFQEASLSALGEFIERNASGVYWWENLYLQTRDKLRSQKLIDLSDFHVWQQPNKKKDEFAYQQPQYWVPAKVLSTGKRCWVPASLVYMFFRREYSEEPHFYPVSSNGAAAFSTMYEARTRALLELVERHEFVHMWYTKTTPRKITLQSLANVFSEAKDLLQKVPPSVSVQVLDTTGELGVPTTVAVFCDTRKEEIAVHVTATADLDPKQAVRKTLKELIRFSDGNRLPTKPDLSNLDFTDKKTLQSYVTSLPKRGMLWSDQSMLPYLEWLIQGEEITYEQYLQQFSKTELPADTHVYRARYKRIKQIMDEKQVRVYFADVTNSVARYAGLKVVRALSPDLLPIFFDEAELPRYHRTLRDVTDLNPVPHPFL